MDPGRDICISNCRRRPHELHKYSSKEDQDQRLEFLISWVSDYYHRDGLMSYRSHKALFDRYAGPKKRIQKQEAEQGAALNRYHAGGSGEPRRVPAVTGSASAHPAPSAS